MRLSSNMVGDDETNFPHKLLLTIRQVENLGKAFANKSSTAFKLSKTQLSKMAQSGAFLGRLLSPLLKTGLPLIKNIIKPLAKSVLIPLGLTAAAAAADAGIHKKILGSGRRHSFSSAPKTTTQIISNDKMKDIIEAIKSLKDSGLLLKGVTETIQNEAKEQKGGFLSILITWYIGCKFIRKYFSRKKNKYSQRRSDSEETRSRNCKSWLLKQKSLKNNNERQKEFLMLPHPLTNFEIQKYNQN